MATSNGQRIAIWVITIVMAVGSLGAYFLVILQNNNAQKQQEDLQKQLQSQQDQQKQSSSSPQPLPGFEATKFDAASVAELIKEDAVVGTGEEVLPGASVKVNYFGNLPDGTIFDSSNRGGKLNPIEFSLSGVIKGWTDGLVGMKVGGKRKLTIPASQAYGEQGSGETIPPNTPLFFVVELLSVKNP